jgi:heme a synthase
MNLVRRLAWVSLVLAFGQIVLGAIVRITGSGLGCGDHWPRCQGYWFPPLNRVDLVIEVSHRYVAATLTAAIIAFVGAAWIKRGAAGGSGRGGLLRPALLAAGLVIAAALFGAVTVWLELVNKAVIVTHLSIAMSLLAVLVVAVVRGEEQRAAIANATSPALRGPPRNAILALLGLSPSPFSRLRHHSNAAVSQGSARAAAFGATLGFLAIVLGALTANVPGANSSCTGFPLCQGGLVPTDSSQLLQFTHRIIAFGLFFFIGWLGVMLTKRREPRLATMARFTLSAIFVQLMVAATMISLRLPPLWRSVHEALGTLVWVLLFALAYVARRLARPVVFTEPNESRIIGRPMAEVRA